MGKRQTSLDGGCRVIISCLWMSEVWLVYFSGRSLMAWLLRIQSPGWPIMPPFLFSYYYYYSYSTKGIVLRPED